MAQRELKSRVASVKNVQKITRAMEMISAARLRRAEQRIEHLRPYADALRRAVRVPDPFVRLGDGSQFPKDFEKDLVLKVLAAVEK